MENGNGDSSFVHSVMNMAGILIGLGQLSTPYALQKGGWASASMLIGFGVLSCYTSCLLSKCLKQNKRSENYVDIGNQALGRKGKLLASIFIYLEIFMSLISYTISLNDNLGTIFATKHITVPGVHMHTSQILTTLAVIVAMPSLWLRDLSSISILSMVGVFMSLVIFSSLGCTLAFGGVKANKTIPVFRFSSIPEVTGLYSFSFASHNVFPNIYRSMRDPSKYNKASILSFTIVIGLYTAIGFMGSKLFGPEVKPQFTLSMPPRFIFTKIALWATVLTPMTKYTLELVPVIKELEPYLPSCSSPSMRLFIRGCVGCFFLTVILVLALSVPYFQYVLALTGSLVSISISITLPCVFYLKIFWSQVSKPVLIVNVIIIIAGCSLGVLGTISSSKSLVSLLEIF